MSQEHFGAAQSIGGIIEHHTRLKARREILCRHAKNGVHSVQTQDDSIVDWCSRSGYTTPTTVRDYGDLESLRIA